MTINGQKVSVHALFLNQANLLAFESHKEAPAAITRPSSMALEKLNGTFVLFRGDSTSECAEISAFAGQRVLFSRIKAIFAILQFADHG